MEDNTAWANYTPIVKAWRAVGIANVVISVIVGAGLFLGNVQEAGASYAPNASFLALVGGLLILFSPLGLLVPFTIAKAIERSERIEALLIEMAKRP
ncbi:hypothetical protein [Caulobacter segnis]|uniref:Uncharacterized protein n=1 Tax=Caulobacter segnis TaxID=88688 RepID=A0A2W5UUK3_9CAUL|nr:hypothetical protein [Caulobacter segnis]PZR30317.1 MAG: hypothetical protein DI526_22775 [Caulobacter segnis]